MLWKARASILFPASITTIQLQPTLQWRRTEPAAGRDSHPLQKKSCSLPWFSTGLSAHAGRCKCEQTLSSCKCRCEIWVTFKS